MAGSTGVHDTVVNQLLSKIDGVEQLNNILVIGTSEVKGEQRRLCAMRALWLPARLQLGCGPELLPPRTS